MCRRENLTNVHYIYGDELKQSAGQARRVAELAVLAMTLREFQVFVVEVCRSCDWNHLIEQYLLGRDGLVTETAGGGRLAAAGSGEVPTGSPPAAQGAAGTSKRRRETSR
jgi:hypothetical protein